MKNLSLDCAIIYQNKVIANENLSLAILKACNFQGYLQACFEKIELEISSHEPSGMECETAIISVDTTSFTVMNAISFLFETREPYVVGMEVKRVEYKKIQNGELIRQTLMKPIQKLIDNGSVELLEELSPASPFYSNNN